MHPLAGKERIHILDAYLCEWALSRAEVSEKALNMPLVICYRCRRQPALVLQVVDEGIDERGKRLWCRFRFRAAQTAQVAEPCGCGLLEQHPRPSKRLRSMLAFLLFGPVFGGRIDRCGRDPVPGGQVQFPNDDKEFSGDAH